LPALRTVGQIGTTAPKEVTQVGDFSNAAPALTVGIDLSDRFTSFCVLDQQGEILEEGRVRTTPEAFLRRFSSEDRSRVVMEVGTHSPWASRLMSELGPRPATSTSGSC
jgi:hypothetical protein